MTTVSLKKFPKIKNVRAQLYSIRNMKTQQIQQQQSQKDNYFLFLQKSINIHNQQIDDPEISQPNLYNNYQRKTIQKKTKLWQYFLQQTSNTQKMPQCQKIDIWVKMIQILLKKISMRIDIKIKIIEGLQKDISDKYKETHQIFKQIQKIKLVKNSSSNTNDYWEKVKVLKENIADINKSISEKYQQLKNNQLKIKKQREERKILLKNVLKNGYYMLNGVQWILVKMAMINYIPNQNDFPDFLDSKSKQYLIKIYSFHSACFKKQQQNLHAQKSQKSYSTRQISSLTKNKETKQIYFKTKEYINEFIRKKQWRNKSVKLPSIADRRENSITEDQKQREKKRITLKYPSGLKDLVKKIQFGIKMEKFTEK